MRMRITARRVQADLMITDGSVNYYSRSYWLFSWDLQSRISRWLCIRPWSGLFRNILYILRWNGLRSKNARPAQGETRKKAILSPDQFFEGFISCVPISVPFRTKWTTCLMRLLWLAWCLILYTFIYLFTPNTWILCDLLVVAKVHRAVSPVSGTSDILPYDSLNKPKFTCRTVLDTEYRKCARNESLFLVFLPKCHNFTYIIYTCLSRVVYWQNHWFISNGCQWLIQLA